MARLPDDARRRAQHAGEPDTIAQRATRSSGRDARGVAAHQRLGRSPGAPSRAHRTGAYRTERYRCARRRSPSPTGPLTDAAEPDRGSIHHRQRGPDVHSVGTSERPAPHPQRGEPAAVGSVRPGGTGGTSTTRAGGVPRASGESPRLHRTQRRAPLGAPGPVPGLRRLIDCAATTHPPLGSRRRDRSVGRAHSGPPHRHRTPARAAVHADPAPSCVWCRRWCRRS